jgi:hypothetical protein
MRAALKSRRSNFYAAFLWQLFFFKHAHFISAPRWAFAPQRIAGALNSLLAFGLTPLDRFCAFRTPMKGDR